MNTIAQPEMLTLTEQSESEFNEMLDRNAEALAEQRSEAAASIRAGMRQFKPSTQRPTANKLLHRVRYGRHGF